MVNLTHPVPRVARLFCALAMLLALPVAAEEWTPTRAFRTFSKQTSRGLPQSSVVALAQDRDGLMWIGTLDGAATFDGRTITPVAAVPGAPQRGVIAAIVARRSGGVYVGSPAGVHAFDGNAWHLIRSTKAVASIAESTDGTLWMADTDGALWTLGARDAWQRHGEVGAPVYAVAAAGDGSVFAATDRNAVRIRGARVEPIPGAPLASRPGAMLVARDGTLYVATLGGTVHWTRGGDGWHQAPFAPWPRNAFRSLAEDRRGRIWAGAFGGGVAFGNSQTPWTVWNTTNGPFMASIMSILGDDEGNVWFGENALGLIQWTGEAWSHRPVVDPSNSASPTYGGFQIARSADGRSLLVAAFEKGFLQLTPAGFRQFLAADGITEDVRAIVEPSPGFYIAGTRFGIFEARPGEKFRQVLKLPGGFVTGLFLAPDGRWFAASTRGVFIRAGEQWTAATAINAQLEDANVRGITWRSNGELWVATLRGITLFRGEAAERITSKRDTAVPDSVNAVLDAGNDAVWIGGTGGVAVRRGGKWTRMTEGDGVPGQTVYSLKRAPDGAIWAGGSSGVGRFANGQWKTWDSREGLVNEECSLNGLLIDADGTVWVGSLGGLARFDPHVTSFPAPPLRLVWRTSSVADRTLHLRWTAPWLGSHPVQYRTRIPRLHDDWSAPASEDHLDVENLGAGDWRVEVQARVEGTTKWTAPLTLDVKVPPFWYETIVARVAMLALLLAIIYFAVRLRVASLHRRAAALEETVRQRTAELAEKVEQLGESEQRALAASRAKSAFLANMSHELRTPLNGVLGFAQLLARRKERDAEDREGLSVIMKSGEHLLTLINDVLSLSKIEAGRVTLERQPFALETLVRDVENVVRIRAEEKGLRLACSIAGAPSRAVVGDEGKLRQILINLVGNAVKFTDSGEVSLDAQWQNGRAAFEVRDTGPGIAAGDLQRLFEPFMQTEAAQRTKEGTGLGLALSRDLARLMDGDITVASEVGRGSTFRVEVALPETANAVVVSKDRRRVVSLAPGQPPIRVLVVDDTALNRTVLSRLLSAVGFEVRTAETGLQAVEQWEAWEPHFIWMDKRMQGVDGLEATRRIRAREASEGRKRVPIIALSASALERERGDILAAGCDDFVAKPFRESLIFSKLREHLGVEYVYEDEAPRTAAPARPQRPAPAAPGARGSVLLVDDDWICREVAQELLRGCGVSVTTASSGAEALTLVGESHFDLVFMDLRMPGMDGVETTRRIRATAGKGRLPIIAMSAESGDGASATMDDAISKPVEPAALAGALDKWLPARG
jgi:signal transduction histidine kinase/CheY-like chemotaxis protein/ligand-binding sensor domain-containing protein